MTQVDGFKDVDVVAVAAKVKKMRDSGELRLNSQMRASVDLALDAVEKGDILPQESKGVSLLQMCADGIYS